MKKKIIIIASALVDALGLTPGVIFCRPICCRKSYGRKAQGTPSYTMKEKNF